MQNEDDKIFYFLEGFIEFFFLNSAKKDCEAFVGGPLPKCIDIDHISIFPRIYFVSQC